MEDMLSFAEQYKCYNVKTQTHNKYLAQQQNICTYNRKITMLKRVPTNVLPVVLPVLIQSYLWAIFLCFINHLYFAFVTIVFCLEGGGAELGEMWKMICIHVTGHENCQFLTRITQQNLNLCLAVVSDPCPKSSVLHQLFFCVSDLSFYNRSPTLTRSVDPQMIRIVDVDNNGIKHFHLVCS